MTAMLTRSHGLGNDYLVADPDDLPFQISPARAALLCDRHLGVGSDGLLLLTGKRGVRIFNPDGSEAEKSGNGIRIFARWMVSTGRSAATSFVVETLGGEVPVHVDGHVVTAAMGIPVFRDELTTLDVDGEQLSVVAVSMGNPHCVIPRATLKVDELRQLGPLVEHHP